MSVHPGLSAVISKCLRKDPEERYKTGAALAHDLQNYRSIGADGDITSVLQRHAHLATQAAPPPSGNGRGNSAPNSSSSGTRIAGRAAVATGSQTRKGKTGQQPVGIAKPASVLSEPANWNKKAVAITLIAFAVVLSGAGLCRFNPPAN